MLISTALHSSVTGVEMSKSYDNSPGTADGDDDGNPMEGDESMASLHKFRQ